MANSTVMTKLRALYALELRLLDPLKDLFLLAIRLYWGWHFFLTGSGKFQHYPDVVAFFTSLGIPNPELNVYMAASTELVGGLFLLAGAASRIITIPLCFTMIVAYLTAHIDSVKNIFADPDKFFAQEPFLFLYAALIVLLFGPGRVSLDYLFGRRLKR